MTKFLDKKEQVYDLKLTPYGRHLLSIGTFKPSYYAFFDDNVLYDGRYRAGAAPTVAGGIAPKESQNNINKRIKEDTPYMGSQVLFRDVEEFVTSNEGETLNFLDINVTPTKVTPDTDVFKFNSVIGDAYLDGETNNAAPAWQVLMLNSNISSSFYRTDKSLNLPSYGNLGYAPGVLVNSAIPQINVQAKYVLKVADAEFDFNVESARDVIDESETFADSKVIRLEMDDPIVYLNEINTQILTENFEIEVFEVLSGASGGLYSPTLQRKYFEKRDSQILNGMMLTETPPENENEDTALTTTSVEYYFDVLTDNSINQTIACEAEAIFEKKGYYIDFDFECGVQTGDAVFYDIYGSVTEPEICQS
tara:strand:- start:9863 stop:10954 length:1092 start_codon:yes stop_codon:yes gene_type:complete